MNSSSFSFACSLASLYSSKVDLVKRLNASSSYFSTNLLSCLISSLSTCSVVAPFAFIISMLFEMAFSCFFNASVAASRSMVEPPITFFKSSQCAIRVPISTIIAPIPVAIRAFLKRCVAVVAPFVATASAPIAVAVALASAACALDAVLAAILAAIISLSFTNNLVTPSFCITCNPRVTPVNAFFRPSFSTPAIAKTPFNVPIPWERYPDDCLACCIDCSNV